MKQFFVLFLFGLLSLGATAQRNGIVRGVVMDTLTKQPVALKMIQENGVWEIHLIAGRM